MPTQQEIQEEIQGWVPNAGAGGGNPNTAYNNPPVPMSDALGNWVTPTVGPAASITPQGIPQRSVTLTPAQFPQLNIQPQALQGWVPPPSTGTPLFPNLGGAGNQPGAGWGVTRPPTAPTSGGTPSPTAPTPGPTVPTGSVPPPTNLGPVGGGGDGWNIDVQGNRNQTDDPFMKLATVTYDQFGNPTYAFDDAAVSKHLDSFMQSDKTPSDLKQKIAGILDKGIRNLVDVKGNVRWEQVADIAADLFGFKGDWYLTNPVEGGDWDFSNIATGVLQRVTGLPIDRIVTSLGNSFLKDMDKEGKSLQDLPWYKRVFASHAYDKLFNRAQWAQANKDWYNVDGADQSAADLANQAAGGDVIDRPIRDNAWDIRGNTLWDTVGGVDSWNLPRVTVGGSGQGEIGGIKGGCVVVNSYVHQMPIAGEIAVGDIMPTIDPVELTFSPQEVTYAETKLMPCVEVVTESGIILECSTTAPISDEHGNQVLAPNLLGVRIPTLKDGVFDIETVTEVNDIGLHSVRHITCGDKFFLAGKRKGWYLFHHNTKASNTTSTGGMSQEDIDAWLWQQQQKSNK